MKLVVVLELNDRQTKEISENSIERMINSSIRLAEDHPKHADASSVEMDWNQLKGVTTDIWWKVQDAIFRSHNKLPSQLDEMK